MNRDIETKEYRFNEAKHLHELHVDGEWKALTGCTTILGVVAKPMLIQWAANMACDYLRDNCPKRVVEDVSEFLQYIVSEDQLKEARIAHKRKKEEAGQKGTDVHSEIEKLVAGSIERNNGILEGGSDIPQVQHFIDWSEKNKVRFLECEKAIYSKEYFLGGIVDLVCEIDEEVWIADIKTGSGIYPEHFAQMAGYEFMLKEMGYDRQIKGHIVLNLKKDGTFQEKRSISVEDAKDFFLACVRLYRLQEKFNNLIK